MIYRSLELFMENLKQLIYGSDNPLINNPSVLSERPQFKLLYQELGSMIQTLSIHEHHDMQPELQKVRNLKTRFKDVAEDAQDSIDLFLSAVDFRDRGIFPVSDEFKTFLDLENVMKSLESIKLESMAINIDNTNMDSSPTMDHFKTQSSADGAGGTSSPINHIQTCGCWIFKTSLDLKNVMMRFIKVGFKIMNTKTQYPSAARTSSGTRTPLKTNNTLEEIFVGHDCDAELVRDKLAEDTKQLGVVSIVGMGGLGKTTLATRVFNDRFVVYHFHIRAWVTVSQTYEKRDLLIQILTSSSLEQDLEEASESQLRGKLHKHLMGKRYLIVIDDIWSIKAWDDLKLFFPHDNTGSRILLTTRLNAVALHAKPHGFVHSLPYLTDEQSWELLRKKVFHDDECPGWVVEPGMQIAKKCKGLPLSVVAMAGILVEKATSKYLWRKIAWVVSSFGVRDEKGCLETLALSYHQLPPHLRECFLFLGGFPEDFRIDVRKVIWLWVAEGFIEKAGNRSLEDTAKAYLMDLVDRNLVIVLERKFNGDVKACKLHDLVRELCLQKATEERFFLKIETLFLRSSSSPPIFEFITLPNEVITIYKQRRVFTNQDIYIVNNDHPPTPSIRSLLCFCPNWTFINDEIPNNLYSFALLKVLDLQKCKLDSFPEQMALLVHLRYLAIWYSCFPSSICNLWSLQTLILRTSNRHTDLPNHISDLINLRHLWSNKVFFLPAIEKPMNLQSISNVVLGDRVDNFGKCFPNIKKLEYTFCSSVGESHFELLPYLENLKLYKSGWYVEPESLLLNNHIWFPATLKNLTLVSCLLVPWSDISIFKSLPNLEVLKLKDNVFVGSQWDVSEQQFPRLKFLRLENLNIKQWEACSTSFPCLKRLAVLSCKDLEEIPFAIGDIATLELIEIHSLLKNSCVESVKRIRKEQHDEGNTQLHITIDGMELSFYLSVHDGSESEWE